MTLGDATSTIVIMLLVLVCIVLKASADSWRGRAQASAELTGRLLRTVEAMQAQSPLMISSPQPSAAGEITPLVRESLDLIDESLRVARRRQDGRP